LVKALSLARPYHPHHHRDELEKPMVMEKVRVTRKVTVKE
jgi:hypothetical protein